MTKKQYRDMAKTLNRTMKKHGLTQENIFKKNRAACDIYQGFVYLLGIENEFFDLNKFYTTVFKENYIIYREGR